MAIYHLTATVISRARGQSATAAAAYRSGSVLRDERYGQTHNFSRHAAVLHTEIMTPPEAPPWVRDRQTLWNRVEAGERRKDAQLARAIEIGMPVELALDQSVALLRDYIAREFVSQGMTADFSIRRNQAGNPHAHIMLTLRMAAGDGFGPKMRQWNRKSNLLDWRAAWAERANAHLARAGCEARIDHRSLESQQSELAPERKTGNRGRREESALPPHVQERFAEQRRIARDNGETIISDPTVAIRALCRQKPIFIGEDLVNFLTSRTADAAQFDAAWRAISASSELVPLPANAENPVRYTSRDLLEAEKSLMKRVAAMSARPGRNAPPPAALPAAPCSQLTDAQRRAVEYLFADGDLKVLAMEPGEEKNGLLAAARAMWEARGLRVIGLTLSRAAADEFRSSTGIVSETLDARELALQERRETAAASDVTVVEGAEMVGLKQLERLLAVADKARGKVLLLGYSQQLAAMGRMSPLQRIVERTAEEGAEPVG